MEEDRIVCYKREQWGKAINAECHFKRTVYFGIGACQTSIYFRMVQVSAIKDVPLISKARKEWQLVNATKKVHCVPKLKKKQQKENSVEHKWFHC